jgi:hypothetical protein
MAVVTSPPILKALEKAFLGLCETQQCESASEEAEALEEEAPERMLDLSLLSETLFEIGAEATVSVANRKVLYRLSEAFKTHAKEECGNDCTHDHSQEA